VVGLAEQNISILRGSAHNTIGEEKYAHLRVHAKCKKKIIGAADKQTTENKLLTHNNFPKLGRNRLSLGSMTQEMLQKVNAKKVNISHMQEDTKYNETKIEAADQKIRSREVSSWDITDDNNPVQRWNHTKHVKVANKTVKQPNANEILKQPHYELNRQTHRKRYTRRHSAATAPNSLEIRSNQTQTDNISRTTKQKHTLTNINKQIGKKPYTNRKISRTEEQKIEISNQANDRPTRQYKPANSPQNGAQKLKSDKRGLEITIKSKIQNFLLLEYQKNCELQLRLPRKIVKTRQKLTQCIEWITMLRKEHNLFDTINKSKQLPHFKLVNTLLIYIQKLLCEENYYYNTLRDEFAIQNVYHLRAKSQILVCTQKMWVVKPIQPDQRARKVYPVINGQSVCHVNQLLHWDDMATVGGTR